MATRLAWGNALAMDGGSGVGGCSILVVGIGKSPLPPSPPQRELVAGLVGAQFCRRLGQHSEDHGAIIIGQFNEARLGNEAAQLN